MMRLFTTLLFTALAGCVVSESPLYSDFPELRPGARIAPDDLSRRDALPDLPATGEVTLGHVMEIALSRNPDMAAARARWGAALAGTTGSGAPPDPWVKFTHLHEPVQTRTGEQRQRIAVMQKIPFPMVLIGRSHLAEDRAKASWIRYRTVVRDVAARIKTAYFEIAYLRRALVLLGQAEGLARQLSSLAQTARAADRATLFDAVKAEGQIAQIMYDRIVIEELLAVETARMNAFLDRSPNAPLPALDVAPYREFQTGLDELYRIALENAEELKLADQTIRIRRSEARLRAYETFPDFEVGYQHGVTDPYPGTPGTGTDSWGVWAGMSIPLWLHRNAARIRQAERRLDAALHEKRGATQSVLLRVRTAFHRVETSRRLVRLYADSLLPQAEDAMAKAETWFRSEGENYSKFLEAQAVLLNFQLASLRATTDVHQALVRLEQVTGGRIVPGEGGGR